MGKKKHNGKRKRQQGNQNNSGGGKNAKRRFERYWVEDCRETKGMKQEEALLTVLITRVELTDDHTHRKKSHEKGKGEAIEKRKNEVEGVRQEDLKVEACEKSKIEAEGEQHGEIPSQQAQAVQRVADSGELTQNDDEVDASKKLNSAAAPTCACSAPQKNHEGEEPSLLEAPKESHLTPSEEMNHEEDKKSGEAADLDTNKRQESDENKGVDAEIKHPEKDEEDTGPHETAKAPDKDIDKTDVDEQKEEETQSREADLNNDGAETKSSANPPCAKVEKNAPDDQINKKNAPDDQISNRLICLRRDASARKKPKRFKRQHFRPLPNGDCGDGIQNPFPEHVVDDKYWAQRHRLFSRFDEGIEMDRESWYSVTPEAIANHIAVKMIQQARLSAHSEGLVVVDAFCGAGGNAIAFARQPGVALVVCVDLDEEKLRLAAHNSRVYGVPQRKLLFLHADACDVLQQYEDGELNPFASVDSQEAAQIEGYTLGGMDLLPKQIGAVFLSPPWGGTDYETIGARKYDLKCIQLADDIDGEQLLEYASHAIPAADGRIASFLPRNTNGIEVAKGALKAGISGTLEMEQNLLNHKFKAITIYTGGACKQPSTKKAEEDMDGFQSHTNSEERA